MNILLSNYKNIIISILIFLLFSFYITLKNRNEYIEKIEKENIILNNKLEEEYKSSKKLKEQILINDKLLDDKIKNDKYIVKYNNYISNSKNITEEYNNSKKLIEDFLKSNENE